MSPDNLIEISFEVCNRVGGIYQVLKSKAEEMRDMYGENYIVIGFYNSEKAVEEFGPREVEEPFDQVLEELRSEGVEGYYGSWRVKGSPRCLLIDVEGFEDFDRVKEQMWEEGDVDSLEAGYDFDEPVAWSYLAGKAVEILEDELEGDTVVQLHEWLSAPALLNFDSPSVFTTHATVMGRALANSDYSLDSIVEEGSVDEKVADELGLRAKHDTEAMGAKLSDVFTTVSDNTAEEAEAIHGVEVDKVIPNGFNVGEFPSLEDLSYHHKEKKEEMKSFLQAYFEPYYDVDLEDDPRIFFTSGRQEFQNKGLDVLIEALREANRTEGEEFFVFLFVPGEHHGIKDDIMENMALHQELEDYVDGVMPEIRKELLDSLAARDDPGERLAEIIERTSTEHRSLQRSFHERRGSEPPLTPFEVPGENEILQKLKEEGLENSEEDRVKIVYYPSYLSRGDQLLSLDYNEAVVASSMGIFPSLYEPWGYTPVETAANGALSVTTDRAGFGQFLLQKTGPEERKGLRVLERDGRDRDDVVEKLSEIINDTVNYSKTEITERKHNARKLAQLTSWQNLSKNYFQAHEMAVEGGKK